MIRFYNGPVLTLQQDQMNITHQEVWVDGNRIVCLGANPGAKADREIDLNGDLLMPAFKNAHTHSAMTFGRSFSDDLPLQSWLYDKIFPLESKLTAEDIYHLSRLAFLEYLESGISACFDMYYFPEAMAKAAVDAGFRTVMCGAVNNFKKSPALLEEYYNTYNNYHPLVSYQLGFHAEYTTNRSIMEAIAALAEKYKAPVYMHASETESEVQDCIGRYGRTPTALFEQLGLWNYGGGAFHSVWVSDEDLNIYKKHGVYAVLNAGSNAKLASVEKRCHFEVADVADFAARSEAIVLTNPPYGERMSTIEGAAKLARTLGQQMELHPCAGVYAITADMDFEHHYGKRANKRRKMYNGMIPCQLYMYYNAPKSEQTRPAKPMPKSGFDGKRTQPGHTGRFEKK